MVYILAHDVSICLLLDMWGDPNVVRMFVQKRWSSLRESQLPSTMSLVSRLRKSLEVGRGLQKSGRRTGDGIEHGGRVDTLLGEGSDSETPWASASKGHNGNVQNEKPWDAANFTGKLVLNATWLTNRIATLTVKEVVQYVRSAPSADDACRSHIVCGSDQGSADSIEGGKDPIIRCTTAEELWALARLISLVRLAVAMLIQQLIPSHAPLASRGRKHLDEDVVDESNHSLLTEFPHECMVLVPIDVCRTIRVLPTRQLISLCNEQPGVQLTGNRPTRSVSFIINPALPPGDNPHRAEKNRRLDAIQRAALAQYYKNMTHSVNRKSYDTYGPVVPVHEEQMERHQRIEQKESFSGFLRGASIGFDMQLMTLSGAAVGYYLGYMRGRPVGECIVYATVGLVFMLLVDGVLLILLLRRQDEKLRKEGRDRWRWLHQEVKSGRKRENDRIRQGEEGNDDDDAAALNARKNA